MADAERLIVAREGTLAIVTLNRPEKLNALDLPLLAELEQAFAAIDREPQVRCAILTGAGEKAFCAGGDIAAWSGLSAHEFARVWIREGHRVFDRLARLRVPLIACLNGHALGGGLELAATADFRVAEAHVRIGAPEAGLGIIPGWSGTQRVTRRFGARLARLMAIAGEVYPAGEALHLGLVDYVAERGGGLARSRELAERIMARGPFATQAVKALINVAEGEEHDSPLEALAGGFAATTEDLQEGVASFREKRTARFEDR